MGTSWKASYKRFSGVWGEAPLGTPMYMYIYESLVILLKEGRRQRPKAFYKISRSKNGATLRYQKAHPQQFSLTIGRDSPYRDVQGPDQKIMEIKKPGRILRIAPGLIEDRTGS